MIKGFWSKCHVPNVLKKETEEERDAFGRG
jgi:hypothetical protein